MKYTLTDAKMELQFIKEFFADEIAADYSEWKETYLKRLQNSTGKFREVYSKCLDVIEEKYKESKLNDAKEELKALKSCSLNEIGCNYNSWRNGYICEIHDALTPEIRRTYQACLDLLEQRNTEVCEQ